MSRNSNPPPFDMSYRPARRMAFGPPRWVWIPPLLYLTAAIGFGLTAELSRFASQSSWWFRTFVELDPHRLVSARTFTLLLLAGALAAIVRTAMRGVRIFSDGIEARGTIVLGWPRVRHCEWVEINRVVFEDNAVGLHLWDGTSLWLPAVADRQGMSRALEKIALLRAIPVHGGSGMDPRLLSYDD